ncbi:MAG: GPMC system MBL fold metallohydrolase [Termitinemataceae bacterium]|nr:MAG: GPMC system MBL fold metallohydrolase [Termitinemataceae bacterium]
MELIVLGSGTSHGIPVVACSCAVCKSKDKHDKRLRCSLYIKGELGERIVIDVGAEFRLQALRAHIKKLDALLLTHSHADHLHGLDDIRALTYNHPLPVYANKTTLAELRDRFSYIWQNTQRGGGKPRIEVHEVCETFAIGGITITPLPIKHGNLDILGWLLEERGKQAAYITDCSLVPSETEKLLESISVLILGALRQKEHPTHFNFDGALAFVKKLSAKNHNLKKVYFTHISHEHSYKEINKYCKTAVFGCNISNIKVKAAYDCLHIFM